jgi:hypothetical protein
MHHSRIRAPRPSLAVLAIVLLGAFLVVPSSATAGDGHGGHSRIQRFTFLGTDPSREGTPATVVANGPIHAKGTDAVISETKDVLTFPDGTISLTHDPKSASEGFDPATCTFRFTERGTYKVTGGTGAYAGATGHGKYRVKGIGVGCDENAPPEVFMLRIFAKGPIRL